MPVYEYLCKNCGERFEELILTPSDEKGMVCPHCKSSRIKREMSSFGIASSEAGISSSDTSACASCKSKSCVTCK